MKYLLLKLLLLLHIGATNSSPILQPKGPIITLTLKDPYFQPEETESNERGFTNSLQSLSPEISYTLSTVDPPFPELFPSLKKIDLNFKYNYHELKNAPSVVMANFVGKLKPLELANWRRKRKQLEETSKDNLITQNSEKGINCAFAPQYNFKTKRLGSSLSLWGKQSSRWGVLMDFGSKKKNLIKSLKATYQFFLPFETVSAVRISPEYTTTTSDDGANKNLFLCRIEAESGRTTAQLNLDAKNPTLALKHQLDERNTIIPEISLSTAKINYNWLMKLQNGQLECKVDPMQAISVLWTDRLSEGGSGRWQTEFKLPLEDSPGPMAVDIRVQRQFVF